MGEKAKSMNKKTHKKAAEATTTRIDRTNTVATTEHSSCTKDKRKYLEFME